jgi:hypothetical protein
LPGPQDGFDPNTDCKYTAQEQVKIFMSEAKSWKGSVDEKYLNNIISKMKDNIGSFFSGSRYEFLRLLGQIKTETGMGYLLRTFKLNNKNLYQTLESDYRVAWFEVRDVLKKNFALSSGPLGCGGEL